MRIDQFLVQNLSIASRSRAELIVKKGLVKVDGRVIVKPSYNVSDNMNVELISDLDYSSQGGYKLKLAIDHYKIDVKDKVCIDIGASNGGFTHCLLINGASKVYAVDVGECALPFYLSNDEKVIVKERLNARYLQLSDIGELADIITIDVSYISIKLILPAMASIFKDNGIIIALIKPQFEAGRAALNKKGIVKDKKVQKRIVDEISLFCNEINMLMKDTIEYTPIEKEKNIEYLALIIKK